MSAENTELDELVHAIHDTSLVLEATGLLREQLTALGYRPSVPAELWRQAVRAQRETEASHLEIFEHIRKQASESLR